MKRNDSAPASTATGQEVEEKLAAFAKQLGFMVDTVQAKAEGWLDR